MFTRAPLLTVAKKKPTRERIDLRAEPDWIARIEEQADRLGISLSAYIRMAVSERVERDEKTQRELTDR